MSKEEMLKMRLSGATYQAVANKASISRQRVQQLLSPPSYIRNLVIKRAGGRCQKCGISCVRLGHVHHVGNSIEDYDDTDNLLFLCCSCHRQAHENEAEKQARNAGTKRYWRGKREVKIMRK